MDLTATFQLTRREFARMARNVPAFRRLRILLLLIAVFGVLDYARLGLWLPLGAGATMVLVEVSVWMGGRRSAPLFSAPWTVHVTDTSLRMDTPLAKTDVDWSVFTEARLTAGYWYLRQVSGATTFLPQHAFDDNAQARLAAFFAERLPPQRRAWYRLG